MWKPVTPQWDNGIIPLLSAGDNGRTILRNDEGRNTNQIFTIKNGIDNVSYIR